VSVSSAVSARRIVFEQLRAVARTRNFGEEWVHARYADRYGSPPPAEWTQKAWGTLRGRPQRTSGGA
jgi:hypothetical protein